MRALCIGDLHLGAGADLGREPGERLTEQSAVLERAVAIANELAVDAVFWLGDAWERRRPTPAELDAFQTPLGKLNAPILIVPGNHDVEGAGRITGYDVSLFGRPKTAIAHEPSVYDLGIGAEIAALPWAPRSTFVAREGGGDVDEVSRQISEKLLDVARGLYAQCDAGKPSILLAHWSVGGAATDSGAPADLFREPVLSLEQLAAIGFDAIVLGHIHKPQVLSPKLIGRDPVPIFYVGSPMPLNFGEATGEPRGAWLLEVGAEGASIFKLELESRPLKSYRLRAENHGPATQVGVPLDYDGAIVKVSIAADAEQARRIDVAKIRRGLLGEGVTLPSGDPPRAHKVWAIQLDVARAETVRGPRMDETVDDHSAMVAWLAAQTAPEIVERIDPVIHAHDDYMEESKR